MGTLYGEPLGIAVKRDVAQLSHFPGIAIKFQKWKPHDDIKGITA